MSGPYTNNAGTVFPFQGSGDPLATAASVTAGDAAVTAAAYATVSATATADGTTTGTLTNTAHDLFVAVTSGNAAHIVVLPSTGTSQVVSLWVTTNGFELKSGTPASQGINGGLGASVSSTIAANSLVVCRRTATTGGGAWICSRFALSDGAMTTVEAAH
jgi:hypothetical protein